MYYLPDGTKKCGYYECKGCGDRFLSLDTEEEITCPTCGEDLDWEIGPDEEAPTASKTAHLIQIVEGEEVEKMDQLLSLAITGGDYEWI